MRVYLGWSEDASKQIAMVIRAWLPLVIQSVSPWMSEIDISPGERWSPEIAKALEQTNYAILCLIPSNLDSKWIHFEAGAVAKSVEDAHVVPLLFGGLTPSDVDQPLGQFQAKEFNRENMEFIVGSLNSLIVKGGKGGLESHILGSTLKKWWPELEEEIQNISIEEGEVSPRRDERDLLEEILNLIRADRVAQTDTIGAAIRRRPQFRLADPVMTHMEEIKFQEYQLDQIKDDIENLEMQIAVAVGMDDESAIAEMKEALSPLNSKQRMFEGRIDVLKRQLVDRLFEYYL